MDCSVRAPLLEASGDLHSAAFDRVLDRVDAKKHDRETRVATSAKKVLEDTDLAVENRKLRQKVTDLEKVVFELRKTIETLQQQVLHTDPFIRLMSTEDVVFEAKRPDKTMEKLFKDRELIPRVGKIFEDRERFREMIQFRIDVCNEKLVSKMRQQNFLEKLCEFDYIPPDKRAILLEMQSGGEWVDVRRCLYEKIDVKRFESVLLRRKEKIRTVYQEALELAGFIDFSQPFSLMVTRNPQIPLLPFILPKRQKKDETLDHMIGPAGRTSFEFYPISMNRAQMDIFGREYITLERLNFGSCRMVIVPRIQENRLHLVRSSVFIQTQYQYKVVVLLVQTVDVSEEMKDFLECYLSIKARGELIYAPNWFADELAKTLERLPERKWVDVPYPYDESKMSIKEDQQRYIQNLRRQLKDLVENCKEYSDLQKKIEDGIKELQEFLKVRKEDTTELIQKLQEPFSFSLDPDQPFFKDPVIKQEIFEIVDGL